MEKTVTTGANMKKGTPKTMTEVLREALDAAPSIRGVAREAGLCHASLIRFAAGKRSLRLDMADKLAAHFKIEVIIRKGE